MLVSSLTYGKRSRTRSKATITIFLFRIIMTNSNNFAIHFLIPRSDRNHDLHNIDHESLSEDQEEAKLDYFREDSLLHAFHALLHRTWERLELEKYERRYELFFYAHQQMIRRYKERINRQQILTKKK